MKKIVTLLLMLLLSMVTVAQTTEIGILSDEVNEENAPLLEQLKETITAVVGQSSQISFKDVLENEFDKSIAKSNYQSLVDSQVDIILIFGVINNLMISERESFPIPTIAFGSINKDLINIPESQTSSGINNLTYLISPISYGEDLDVFKTIYDFKNIAVIIDDYVLENLPIENIFEDYAEQNGIEYKFIPIDENMNISGQLEDVDAVYLAGGFYRSDEKLKRLVSEIANKNLPSFSAFENRTVEEGILAINQPSTSLNQTFRRIALNIESIISGVNASELPLLVDYDKKLTINYSTAQKIGLPIRYSLLAKADFTGTDNFIDSEISLSLVDIMNDIVDRNLSLEIERKNIELTTQDVKFSKSNYLPEVIANVNGVYVDPNVAELSNGQNPEFSTSGNVVANQLIYSEAATAGISIQKSLNEAQKEAYNSAELDELLNGAIAYLNALILKTNARIQNENLKLTKRNLEISEENYEAGFSGKSDVLRFQSQLAQNTQSLIEASNQLTQSFNTINQLLNFEMSNKIDIKDAELSKDVFEFYKYEGLRELLDNPSFQSTLIDFFVEEAYRNSPELKNLNYNLDAVRRNYDLNDYGRFIPTVSFQGQYNLAISESGVGSTPPVGIPEFPNSTYNLGLNVSLPIFQQNQRNINRQTAVIEQDQLQIQQSNIKLEIQRSINDVVLDLVNQISNIETSKIAESTAKESLELTQLSYSQGTIPIIQLIDAQNNYLQAQLARATASYNYLIVSMQLERLMGYFFLMHTDQENEQFTQRASQYILNRN